MPVPSSRNLDKDLDWLTERLHIGENNDMVHRSFVSMGQKSSLLYVEGMSSGAIISEHVLRPLLRCRETAKGPQALDMLMNHLLEASSVRALSDLEEAVEEMMAGQCIVVIDTVPKVFLVDTRSFIHRQVSTPMTETVINGPHEAFNETLRDNLTLLHRKVQNPELICKMVSVGEEFPTKVAMCYINGVCKQETVKEMLRRLEAINVDLVSSCGMLEQLIEDNPSAPLPQVVATERPDRVASFLVEGQVVLMMDGSPRVLAMPTSFWHIMHASDDTAMRWQYGSLNRLVRFFALFCTVMLPALFVTLVIFHPVALPMTLLTSIMESRTVLPISLFGETILMLTLFNLINEAHTRVPGVMGSSLGLVSALILGSAAVEAQLISPVLIIVVAMSGLGSYAVPDYSMGLAFRTMQFFLVLAGWVMGLEGVIFGALICVCRIAGMTSLNQPYMAPFSPTRTHNPDLILRAPIYRQRLRSYIANPAEAERTQGYMRGLKRRKGSD